MSELIWSKIIDALGSVLGVIATSISIVAVAKISSLKHQINSRMDQWVEAQKNISNLEGNKQGLKEGREAAEKQQAAITAAALTVSVITPEPDPNQKDVLDKIEQNTKDISDNTQTLKPKPE